MTRTKNRVFFIAPEENPSEFLLEIKHDYKNVSLKGKWNEDPEKIPSFKKSCPMCGWPMQFKYKSAYGLRLYICTNEPEVCGFMTNEYKAGKMSIIKCDSCRDGYLIVKPGRGENAYNLGCTNYKKDGSGCNRLMNAQYFYNYMGITDTTPASPRLIKKGRDVEPVVSTQQETVQPKEEPERDIIVTPDYAEVYYRDIGLKETTVTILQCLSDISREKFYNARVLLQVLVGDPEIKPASLKKTECYGKLRSADRLVLEYIIVWLIKKSYILRTKGKYPVLHPTYNGLHYDEVMKRQSLIALKKALEVSEGSK